MKYDIELMLKDVETTMKEKLNDCINAINAEKLLLDPADNLQISTIADDKYFASTMSKNRGLLNVKGFFVMYGISQTPVRGAQVGDEIEDLTITFEVCTFDNGDKNINNLFYQLLRYQRALKGVIKNTPEVFRNTAKPLITGLKPEVFPYDAKYAIISTGINLKASVA